jgi:hypothetical protein
VSGKLASGGRVGRDLGDDGKLLQLKLLFHRAH